MSNEPSLDDLKEAARHLPEKEQTKLAWDALINHPLVQAMRQAQEEENRHIHGPFTFLINERNVLRGCQVCGATWIGFIGNDEFPIDATWHYVGEPEEED